MSEISAGYAQDFLISKAIQTIVNGIEVYGNYEAGFHNIETTITKPFKNIRESWHVPYFAQGRVCYHGKPGGRRVQESLKAIYWVADYVQRKTDMLKGKYQELEARKAEVSEGRITEREFKLKRYTMKNQLKSGDISNRLYQRRLGSMHQEVEALNKRLGKLEGKFFEAYFPMSVYGSLRESVIAILDGKKSLV